MSSIHERECEATGVDPRLVAKWAKALERIATEAGKHGVTIFGGSGSGDLRAVDATGRNQALILAQMRGRGDGGDGATCHDDDGLLRGDPV